MPGGLFSRKPADEYILLVFGDHLQEKPTVTIEYSSKAYPHSSQRGLVIGFMDI